MNARGIGPARPLPLNARQRFTLQQPRRAIKLPLLVWAVLITTFIGAFLGGVRVFSFLLQGWAWVVPFTLAGLQLARFISKVRFPFLIWVPWILWVTIYLILDPYENALQRTVMLICPMVVGAAVSSLRVDAMILDAVGRRLKQAAPLFFLLVLVILGVFLTGQLPETSGLAPQVMTAALLASVFAVRYAQREKRSIIYWGLMAAVPVMALTRTGIVATALTLPLTLGPLKLRNRVLILGLMAVGAVGLFYSERVQHKMFYSGRGTLEDVRLGNPDFRTSGRTLMWESLWAEVERQPWFGHGANAQENFLRRYFAGLSHPHNDWLRLLYDYGYLGVALFSLSMIGQLIHLLWITRRSMLRGHWLVLGGASSFLPFILFMFTDNIILYAAFFGNLQFAFLGMVYAALEGEEKEARIQSIRSTHTYQHSRNL